MEPGTLLEGRTGGLVFAMRMYPLCYLGLGYLLNNIQLFAVYIISDLEFFLFHIFDFLYEGL